MKNVILASLVVATLGLGVAAQANNTSGSDNSQGYSQQKEGKHAGKRGGRHGGAKKMERLAKKLNLSDAQKTQIKALHEARRANKGTKDKASREAARAEFTAILTPEQLTKLEELKQNRKNRDGKRGGKRNNAG